MKTVEIRAGSHVLEKVKAHQPDQLNCPDYRRNAMNTNPRDGKKTCKVPINLAENGTSLNSRFVQTHEACSPLELMNAAAPRLPNVTAAGASENRDMDFDRYHSPVLSAGHQRYSHLASQPTQFGNGKLIQRQSIQSRGSQLNDPTKLTRLTADLIINNRKMRTPKSGRDKVSRVQELMKNKEVGQLLEEDRQDGDGGQEIMKLICHLKNFELREIQDNQGDASGVTESEIFLFKIISKLADHAENKEALDLMRKD